MSAIFLKLNRILLAMPHWQVMIFALILVTVVAALDLLTGFEISFSVFYLIPIVLVTWYVNRGLGSAMCLLSATVWLTVDIMSGHTYSQVWMPFWNSVVRFIFFILICYLSAVIRMHLEMEKLSARTDPLTGMKNLRCYREQADLLFRNAARHRFPIAAGSFDLDGFKSINDTLGHAEGDRVLKAISNVLTLVTREGDVIARLGGDEFGVVLANTDMSGAKVFFDRLYERLLAAMKEGGWEVGFSIGVAVFPDQAPTFSDAVKWADSLMYHAKQTGGNKVIYQLSPGGDVYAQQAASPDAPILGRR